MRHYARQWHRQIVAQAEICEVSHLHLVLRQDPAQSLAAMQHTVQQLIAFVTILTEQGRQVLHSWRFQGQEAIALEHALDFPQHITPFHDRVR